jgi:hypothetical protein
MMSFIPHIVPVFCTSLYSIICVPYMAVLHPFSFVFSLKGITSHLILTCNIVHAGRLYTNVTVICNCVLNVNSISTEVEIFCVHK